jgi:threonine synthase
LKDPETAISVNEHKAFLVPEDMERFWEDLKKGVKA